MKSRFLLIIGLIAAGLTLFAWRADFLTFGQDAPNRTYNSPVGQITLPTVEGTAGTLGTDYELARFAFGVRSNVPQVGDLAGDTGNGFSDRYDFENLDAFPLAQAANLVGDLDSLDPANSVLVGGRIINPGFRFVHIGQQAYVWRVGEDNDMAYTREVTVFPSIDHLFDPEVPGYGPKSANPPAGGFGNILLEACEFTVWGTDDPAEAELAARTPGYFGRGGTGQAPNNKWYRATLTKIFADGFKDFNNLSPFAQRTAGSDPSPQEGDDFASQWQFRDSGGQPVAVKFVAVYANRTRAEQFFRADSNGNIPGNLAQSNEAEIDGLGFKKVIVDKRGSIAGRVVNDANANGRIDATEQPIAGVTIRLTGPDGDFSATTDAGGNYKFMPLTGGVYRVTEVNLPGYLDTGVLPGPGNTAIDLNNIRVSLDAGEMSIENNFLDVLPPPDTPNQPLCTPGCFNSVDMWLLYPSARQTVYNNNGGVGSIFILSLNRPAQSDAEVEAALLTLDTAKDRLNAQFVAAQLNTLSYPQTIFNRASCFYNGPNVIVRVPGDPRVLEMLNQARTIFGSGDDLQIDQLAIYLELINNITATRGIICPFADP